MLVIPLKSKYIQSEENLIDAILDSLIQKKIELEENDILLVTSKVVSLSEGRLLKCKSEEDFRRIVRENADKMLSQDEFALTIKHGVLIPNAGIDRSNIEKDHLLLYPEDPQKSADDIRENLSQKLNIKNLGIIITDSVCHPLRVGVSGLALSVSGIEAVEDLRGQSDLCGNILSVSQRNIADMLASAALMEMGEGDEGIPFAIIKEAKVRFVSKKYDSMKTMSMEAQQCLFNSLYPPNLLS